MHVININPEFSPHLSSVDFRSAACNYEIFYILFLCMNGTLTRELASVFHLDVANS